MFERLRPVAALSTVAMASALTCGSAFALESNGYFRAGPGATKKDAARACYGLQGPGLKYRLGNECDFYGEFFFSEKFNLEGVETKVQFTPNLWNGGTDSNDAKLGLAEMFVEGTGFDVAPEAKFWIGKRYYNRHDVHINDYYYWNNSGLGGGIEDIALGSSVKMAAAYHSKGDTTLASDSFNGLNTQRLSLRVYDIPVNPNGKLETELVFLRGSSPSGDNEGSGHALFVQHTQGGILGGFNKLAFMTGKDAGFGGNFVPTYRDANDGAKGKDWRLVDQIFIAPEGSNWSGLATVGIQQIKPDGGDKQRWMTFGVRPQYNFSDNFSLAVEFGHDRTKTDGGDTAKLTKLTVAPQLSLSRGFWARPVFRAFATYADWNDAAGDAGTGGTFGSDTDGMSFGIQVEAWW